jgi:hypothetical protein
MFTFRQKKFCSEKCKNDYLSSLFKGHPVYFIPKKDTSKREDIVCSNPLCNRLFSALKCSKRKYCSKECTNEHRKTLLKGTKQSRECVSKRVESMKGFKHTEESKQKMSKVHKGRKAWNKGIPQTEEQKQKISKTVLDNIYSLTRQERKEKYGKQNIGRRITDTQKKKQSFSILKTTKEKGRKGSHVSKSEIAWGKEIEKIFNIKLEHSKWIKGRCFDYKYKNYLFELDGEYWHSIGKRKEVDILKEKIAKETGYTLFRFSLDSVQGVRGCVRDNYLLLEGIFNER